MNAAEIRDDESSRSAMPAEGDAYGRTRQELDFWINCVGAPLVVVEKDALVVRCANRSATAFFGISPEAFIRAEMVQLVGPEANNMLGRIWSTAPVGVTGEPFLIRAMIDGQERLLMVQVSKLVVEGDQLRLFTFMDAPPQGSVAMAGWQETMIDMINWLPFGFEISSTDDQIQFANTHFLKLFGYSPDEIECIDDWWQLAYPDPEYREYAKNKWYSEIALARAEERDMTPFDLQVAIAGGGTRTIQFRHRTIGNFNVNLYLDVTRERAHAEQLKALAETDPLTGAINRRRFFEQPLPEQVSGEPLPVAVLMLDIDHFKQINDRYGHGIGDLVLREFTVRCQHALKPSDLFARFGGEEFAVLLQPASPDVMADVAERLRKAINGQPFDLDGVSLNLSVSIGCAAHKVGDTLDLIISRADKALYQAKMGGRNCVSIAE